MSTNRAAEAEYEDPVIGETAIPRTFEDAADRFPTKPAQLYKGGIYDRSLVGPVLTTAPAGEFRALAYEDVREIVRNLATGFRTLGLEAGDRVALYAHTRMEWAQCDYALLGAGGVVTTVYPTVSTDRARYLLDDPDAAGVVLENRELLDRVLEVEADLDGLEWIAVIDDIESHPAADRSDVYSLAEIHERGAREFDPTAYEEWLGARSLDDLASIIYTSGTTGRPKGVKLTHGNFRANINQVRRRFGPRADRPEVPAIDETTRVVSYLPLAHVFERLAGHFVMFASGASVAYAETPDTLREDFSAVEPTSATSVPRVYEQMYKAIRSEATSSDLRARIFNWATEVGRSYHRADAPGPWLRFKRGLADRLVFRQIREALGGNLEFMISGGGSLSADLCALYHGMGLPILEGYGLTETAPVLTVNPPDAPIVGTIGPPVVDVETRLDAEVRTPEAPEHGGEVGELLVKGPNVTDGYLDNPGANERAFTADGWFRTGDIVEERPDGYFVFRERLKEVMVLSTGKNVAPGPIEDAFAPSELVEQCLVLGDDRPYVAALIVPDLAAVNRWAEQEGVSIPEEPSAVVEDPDVRKAIAEEVGRINERFESYEQIETFRLVPEPFSEENELLTPTMKKRRHNIVERYADTIESMFDTA